MKTITNLNQLLAEQIFNLFDAEAQLLLMMPNLISEAESPALKKELSRYTGLIQVKIARLERACSLISCSEDMWGGNNLGIDGLIDDTKNLLKLVPSKPLRDLALIAEIQRINHLLIADYSTAYTVAASSGNSEVAQLLQQTLAEEKQADTRLTAITKEKASKKAVAASEPLNTLHHEIPLI